MLVTGAGGMLAQAMRPRVRVPGSEVLEVFFAQEELERYVEQHGAQEVIRLGDAEGLAALQLAGQENRPEVVFHFAAWTDVDGCEFDYERARRANSEACRQAALVAREHGALLVAISTDYVFDGRATRPYAEDHPTGPLSAYGRSKLEGERMIRDTWERHLIVRSAWLFGRNGRNFVDTIRARLAQGTSVKVVDDQRGSPTWTEDLAEALQRLVGAGATGTFHAVNSGDCTWYELAQAIREETGAKAAVEPTKTAAINRPAARPAYSVLDTTKYERVTGQRMPRWRDALSRYLMSSGA